METCETTSIKKETFDSVLMYDGSPLIREEHPIHTTDLTSFEMEAIDPLLMYDDTILIKEEMDTYNKNENNFSNIMQIDSMTPPEDMSKMENCDLTNIKGEALDPILIKEELSTYISEENNLNSITQQGSITVSEMEDYELPSIKEETHDSISMDDEKLIIKEEFDTHTSGRRNLNDITRQDFISPLNIFLPPLYTSDYPNYNYKLTFAKIVLKEAERTCAYAVQQKLFHIKSGESSGIHLEFNLKNIPEGIKLDHYITLKLKRTNPNYEHLPVDVICEKHKYGYVQFPVEGRTCTTHNEEKTNMIKFNGNNENMKAIISKEVIEKGEINICMRVLFACNDSCATSSTPFKSKEKARDMAIFAEVGVIYTPEHTEIIHSLPPVPVWLKAVLVKRDLIKDVRRNPKGFLVMHTLENKSQGSKNISKNIITKTQLRTKLISGASRKESTDLVTKYLQQEQPSLEVLKKLTNVLEKYCKN